MFSGFLEIAGYGEEGIRVRFITENEVGVLGKIVALIVEEDLNISHTVNIPRKDGKVVIEVQIDGKIDLTALKDKFEKKEFKWRRSLIPLLKSFKQEALEPLFFYNQKR